MSKQIQGPTSKCRKQEEDEKVLLWAFWCPKVMSNLVESLKCHWLKEIFHQRCLGIDVIKYLAQNNLGMKKIVCTTYLRFWFFEENKNGNSK